MFCVGLMLTLSENDTVLFPSNKCSLGIFNSSKIAPRVSLEDRQNPLQIVQSPALDPPSNSSKFYPTWRIRCHYFTNSLFHVSNQVATNHKPFVPLNNCSSFLNQRSNFFFLCNNYYFKKTLKIENGLNSCLHFGFLYSEFDLLTVGD